MRFFLQFPKSSLTLAQEFFQVIIKESVLLWIWVLSLYFNSDQEFFSQQHWKQFE